MGGKYGSMFIRSLMRRKKVDSGHGNHDGQPQLARALTVPHITAIGIGTTIGAGVYILIGTVARECSGPALALSFLFAGVAAALSAFCYAELASRFPSAGSAYHYSYVCAGEGVAWLVGWALTLEYTIGGAAIARGISPNLALLLGGMDSLPSFLARQYIPGLDATIDPCAAILIVMMTVLLCLGIKESASVEAVVTSGNICALVFVIIAGAYLGFKTGWAGYELSGSYMPFGINGVLAGSATVFFSYIGFDAVASTAEEVKNPRRDLPLGIAFALIVCCALYMLVSVVVVGLVPYYELDPDTPITSAFSSHGMQWAAFIITIGASTALCASLLGSFLPQPRVFMAMARDGLLPSFFSDINPHTQVPVKSTIATGSFAALLALFMDVSQLAGMVSIGTLLTFTMVAISVLIIRYVPPDEVPLPLSLQESVGAINVENRDSTRNFDSENTVESASVSNEISQPLLLHGRLSSLHPQVFKQSAECSTASNDEKRRTIAGWAITLTCVGAILLTSAASNLDSSIPRFSVCAIGAALLVSSLIALSSINQDDGRHRFGHPEGFISPFVPLLPVVSILINIYLLVNLGAAAWIRVLVWMAIGVLIYVFYGRNHSLLQDAVYVPSAYADEIYSSATTLFAVQTK